MLTNFPKTLMYLAIVIIIIFGLYFAFLNKNTTNNINPGININNSNSVNQSQNTNPVPNANQNNVNTSQQKNMISQPIADVLNRITKKPFGIKVSPENSPVNPERFSGHHTGVDFETFDNEQNIDVPIYAICSGPLLKKEWASGYGGMAVQKCEITNQSVTVIYGHLKLASIQINTNQELASGQQIGILGRGYSMETDRERKHLHLGIHQGQSINIQGYVQNEAELSQWLDAVKYL